MVSSDFLRGPGESPMFGRDLLDRLPTDVRARLRRRAQPKWVAPMLATLTNDVFS